MEFQLNEEEKLVRDQFRQYCKEKLLPRITDANRNEGLFMMYRVISYISDNL